MAKIKCTMSYDGTGYAGFQSQPNERTIQGQLQEALKKIHKGIPVKIHGSGRTDAGVHAKGQVFHFETDYRLSEDSWKRALNTLLPEDLYIHQVEIMPDSFHARYHAIEKEYHYFISIAEYNVFQRNYMDHVSYKLNLDDMRRACALLEGEHDFTTFSSAKATTKGMKVRTLYEASFEAQDDVLEFTFRGNGFLYNMVRIMVGVLIDVGRGRFAPEIILEMFEKKDRQLAGRTAPPQGLYLWKVTYGESGAEAFQQNNGTG